MSLNSAEVRRAARVITEADGLVIAAGAGMGVDSGLLDFRGNEGFWNASPALGRARLDFRKVVSPAVFHSDPDLAWGFYGRHLQLYRDTVPHPGFEILKRWARQRPGGAFVFTSNVDGQFQRADFAEDHIEENRGSIHFLQCLKPCSHHIWPADKVQVDVDDAECRWRGPLPRCPYCSGPARPNILMFRDSSWLAHRADEQAARMYRWLRNVQRPAVVELGAGTHVPSVRGFSHQLLVAHGARLVRINPRDPRVPTPLDASVACGALEGLTAIAATLNQL